VAEHGPSEAERIRRLYAQMERLKAELTAVETGTLPLLEERGELVATELADALGVSVQAANNRLVALVRAGLAERVRVNPVRGGKRFVYRAESSSPDREGAE
jgi:predicted transcriptional regulator